MGDRIRVGVAVLGVLITVVGMALGARKSDFEYIDSRYARKSELQLLRSEFELYVEHDMAMREALQVSIQNLVVLADDMDTRLMQFHEEWAVSDRELRLLIENARK